MVVTPVYAPNVPSYVAREPYLTVAEYLAAPTGTDTTQLLPGGNAQQNRDALYGVISRASSEADTYCYGREGCLAATVDVQVAPPEGWRIQNRNGRRVVVIPLNYTPVVAITGISLGYSTSGLTTFTDLSGIWFGGKVITVPVQGIGSLPAGVAYGGPINALGDRVWGTVTYVNGFFNAALSVAAVAGATSITPTDVLGLYPGLPFSIYDSTFAHSETCTVAAGYVPGAAVVPLASPLAWDHVDGTSVSAMPPVIRQAVMSLTAALIKRRGGESIMLQSIHDEPSRKTIGEPGMSSDEEKAHRLLAPFRRVR